MSEPPGAEPHDMHDRTVEPPYVFPQGMAPAHGLAYEGAAAPPRRGPAMRRRLRVFAGALLLCLAIGQGVNVMRPGVYVAEAKLQITPAATLATAPAAGEAAVAPYRRSAVSVEAEVLGSRPVVEQAVARLKSQGHFANLTSDAAVFEAQRWLAVTALDDTPLVQVRAQGPDGALLARLVNAVVDAYRDRQASSAALSSETDLTQARAELQLITDRLADKRRSLELASRRGSIDSTVREENRAVSRLKGLSASLASATEREAVAAGRVRALEQAIAEGRVLPQARDNPTVAHIEQRLSQQREDWRALERQFTPQYLEMDADARALRTRIANLEQQLESERLRAQQTALADAREELAHATATAQRLQQQLAGDRQDVQTFNRQLALVQGLQGEAEGLEKMHRSAQDRLLTLEATAASRRPSLQVLEAAVAPAAPWRPDYWRDAGLVLAGSLGLAFAAVWFVEFFSRAEPRTQGLPPLVIAQPWMAGPAPAPPARLTGTPPPTAPLARVAHDAPLLHGPLPHELAFDEVARLLDAAAPEHLPVVGCLLCGLTVDEVAALRLAHVDPARDRLRVPGDGGRVLPLTAPVRQARDRRAAGGAGEDEPLFLDRGGRALTAGHIAAIITATVHDAHLERAASVTPASLRHTFVAFVVRQGLRFSELDRVVGGLDAEMLNALAPLAPTARRVPADAVQWLLPPLQARQPRGGQDGAEGG